MRSELAALTVGALVALVIALASGRVHGWSLVVIVVIGAFIGAAMAEAWHRGRMSRD